MTTDNLKKLKGEFFDYWDGLKMEAWDKCMKGIDEHSENWAEVNYKQEKRQEKIDLLNYDFMEEYALSSTDKRN